MGAWGYGLFQSDNEFDVVVSDIDEETCKLAKDPNLTLFNPKNKKRVVKKLNNGLFRELLQLFVRKEQRMESRSKIPAKELAYVHQTLNRTPMYEEAKAQVQKGLEGYKGEAWDFESKGLIETANASSSAEEESDNDITPCFRGFLSVNVSVGPRGFMLLNVMENWKLMPEGMPGKRHDDYYSRKQMEQINKDMDEWKAKEAPDPKPKSEPKPHTELPRREKDRIEKAVK
ncbi:MAG: hypothetical protein Q9198_006810 [Flavoplaca austrocitrina]